MNKLLTLSIIIAISLTQACNSENRTKKNKLNSDGRPKLQKELMSKLNGVMMNYEYSSNAVARDKFADSLTKFALDSLKEVKDWVFLVKDIDDNEFASNPVSKATFAGKPIYNLRLISIINPEAVTADTLSIDNYVNFISTVPKKSTIKTLQNQVEVIKSLKSGDTVLVDGSITYINTELKVDFTDVVKNISLSNIDILLKSIKKK